MTEEYLLCPLHRKGFCGRTLIIPDYDLAGDNLQVTLLTGWMCLGGDMIYIKKREGDIMAVMERLMKSHES